MISSAPHHLFLRRAADPDRGQALAELLQAVLPRLNWRSHIFVVDDHQSPAQPGVDDDLVEVITSHLDRHRFTSISLHPLLRLRSQSDPTSWLQLLAPALPFQNEAYSEQGESRLLVLPILDPGPGERPEQTLAVASFFHSRLARPSLYLSSDQLPAFTAAPDDLRLYVEPDQARDSRGFMGQLWANHIFETVLDRVSEQESDLLAPCRSHLVLDQERGGFFGCFRAWHREQAASDPEAALDGKRPATDCADCIRTRVLAMAESLLANRRQEEGQRVYFQLGMAFSERQQHSSAAELAHRAYELAGSDRDRTAALIHAGLCHFSQGELPAAEQALELATGYTDDPGLVAYHRGRVQFAWHDEIEALERFEEALAAGSPEVSPRDLRFNMAISHINLAEYPEARPHLDAASGSGPQAPIAFYRGICDLNQGEGDIEGALARFRESLALGPAAEDLGRVLFYIATCHKEKGQFDDAIAMLQQAVEADPEDLANHNLLGFCYYKLGRHEEAVTCFLRAVTIDPSSAIDWANLGSNLRDLGRIDEAKTMYRKALTLDPTIGFARASLTRLSQESEPGN